MIELSKSTSVNDVTYVLFDTFEDEDIRGKLVPISVDSTTPFYVSRLFYVYDVPNGDVRGKHAHIECGQIYFALHGVIKVKVHDGKRKRLFTLDNPNQALYVPAGVWSEEKYKNNAVLMVLCSDEYNSNDYIRDWNEFITWKRSSSQVG